MNQSEPYYLGIDTGVSNAGHAAIDENFNILKYHHKKEIGVTQFKKANTAEKRRSFRGARRRYSHRSWRLKQFERYMAPYFEEKGVNYKEYLKAFNNSWISPKDKNRKQLKFNTELSKYNTRFEAMVSLIENDDSVPKDPARRLQLIFEVMHPLIKYRGNFLEKGEVEDFAMPKLDYFLALNEINAALVKVGKNHELSEAYLLNITNAKKIESVMSDETINNAKKCDYIADLLVVDKLKSDAKKLNKTLCKSIASLILGRSVTSKSLKQLFNYEAEIKVNNKAVKGFRFGSGDTQDILDVMYDSYPVNATLLLDSLYKTYRQIKLFELLPGGKYFESMVKSYSEFKEQLANYKKALKTIKNPDVVNTMKDKLNSYLYFKRRGKKIDYETFIASISKETKGNKSNNFYPYRNENKYVKAIFEQIDKGNFLKKQRGLDNNNLPHQVMQLELRRIIDTQSKVKGFEWLAKDDLTNKHEKYNLERFIDFRIPYYVGPLDRNNSSEFSWVCYKDKKKIPLTVWNFNERIDFGRTINHFIRRMTATDTYILGEAVLPASSLIYQKYEVLNELNKIKVKGQSLSVNLKQDIFDQLFKKGDVNLQRLCGYLNAYVNEYNNDLKASEITGLPETGKFNSSLSTYHLLKEDIPDLISDPKYQNDIDQIVEILTVFDKDSIKVKKEEISKLKISKIDGFPLNKIASKQFKGWGRLSKKLLCDLKSKTILNDNKEYSILDILWFTDLNLQQIIKKEDFKDQIQKLNKQFTMGESREDKINRILQYSRISAHNERSIRQLVAIVDDYTQFNNRAPKMISLEFARGSQKNANNSTKYERVQQILQNAVTKIEWDKNLEKEFNSFKSNKQKFGLKEYLYFTQNGKDIYDSTPIDINDLDRYDIDHIYARSKHGTDNSLDNIVLTSVKNNRDIKKDKPAVKAFSKQKDFWKNLKDCRLISEQKYKNLNTDWTEKNFDVHQKSRMIARSLVDTSAITKITAQILNELYPDTTIIAINAGLSQSLREKFNLFKVRDVNDYHHAVDAYLAAFSAVFMWKLYPSLRPMLDYNDYLVSRKVKDIDLNKFGFATLNEGKKHHLVHDGIITNSDGEIVGNQKKIIKQLEKLRNPKWMSVVYRPIENGNKGGGLFKQTINKAKQSKKAISKKRNLDSAIYGYYDTPNTKSMMLIKFEGKYKIINIPNGLNLRDSKAIDQLIKKNLPKNKQYRILIKNILPFTMAQDVIKKENSKYKAHYLIVSADGPTNYDQLWLPNNVMELLEELDKRPAELFENEDMDKKLNNAFEQICYYVEQYSPLIAYQQTAWQALVANKEKFIKLKANGDKEKLQAKYGEIISILQAIHSNSSKYFNISMKKRTQ